MGTEFIIAPQPDGLIKGQLQERGAGGREGSRREARGQEGKEYDEG